MKKRVVMQQADLHKPWSEEMGTTTVTMMIQLQELLQGQEHMKDGFEDTEHVLEEQQKEIGVLTGKLREMLELTIKLDERCVALEKRADRHELVLFANTEDNEFGARGLYVEIGEERRLRARLKYWFFTVGAAAGAVTTWLVNIVSKIKGMG